MLQVVRFRADTSNVELLAPPYGSDRRPRGGRQFHCDGGRRIPDGCGEQLGRKPRRWQHDPLGLDPGGAEGHAVAVAHRPRRGDQAHDLDGRALRQLGQLKLASLLWSAPSALCAVSKVLSGSGSWSSAVPPAVRDSAHCSSGARTSEPDDWTSWDVSWHLENVPSGPCGASTSIRKRALCRTSDSRSTCWATRCCTCPRPTRA